MRRAVWQIQGFHLVTFVLAVFLLNQVRVFWSLTNKLVPVSSEVGPSSHHGSLPEFKLWVSSTQALVASICLSYFPLFDIAVNERILLTYFAIAVPWVVLDIIIQQRRGAGEAPETGQDSVVLWTTLASLVVGTAAFDAVYTY